MLMKTYGRDYLSLLLRREPRVLQLTTANIHPMSVKSSQLISQSGVFRILKDQNKDLLMGSSMKSDYGSHYADCKPL